MTGIVFFNELEDGMTMDQRIDPYDTSYEPGTNNIYFGFNWRATLVTGAGITHVQPVIAKL